MKKITAFLSATVLLVALFAATAFKTLPPRPSANGQGTLTIGEQTRHFSFSANTLEDNSVAGSGQLTYTAGGLHIEFNINCLTRVNNTATMSGVITAFSTDPTIVGSNCWFRVVDNGEGANANPDQITLLVYYPTGGGTPCTGNTGFALNPIEGGNIQVKN